MKKIIIAIAVAVVVALAVIIFIYAKTWHFWRGELMSLKTVCERWGEESLDIAKFKLSEDNEPVRAKMTCSLLKNQKKYIGIDSGEIRKIFGDPTGHYFSDMFPAYIIESAKTREKDSWQIVFLINRKEQISKIVVHKNCCYR